jgi:23S rRNA pseudouridine1911/1915/1917 synthase
MKAVPILFRDDRLIVISKPPGLLSVPAPGVRAPSVPEVLGSQGLRALPVHRLDREVSGAMLLALDAGMRDELEALFRARAIQKTYWALVQGHPRNGAGTFHEPILEEGAWARVSARGKPALTRYRTLERLPAATVVEIDLPTGRHNQIRVHFAHAGLPLVGERKYARGKDSAVHAKSRRIALHAWRLRFAHPRTGEDLEIEAPLPADLRELVQRASAG